MEVRLLGDRPRCGIRREHLDGRRNAIRGRQILSQLSFGSVSHRVKTIRSRTARVHGTKIGGAVTVDLTIRTRRIEAITYR